MSTLSKRSTVYFEPAIHNALKMRAASSDSSVSELIDEAVRLLMREDQEDLAAVRARVDEPEISYETLINSLEADGKLQDYLKNSVSKDLKSVPKSDVIKIISKIDSFAEDPRRVGEIKLSGDELFRIRQGLYRILYEIKDRKLVVLVIKVGHKSDVYKRT